MPDKATPHFYLVCEAALPEVFLKVLKAKELLETGEVATIAKAADMVGISRSAFYKYKEMIRPFLNMGGERVIIFDLSLKNRPGVLSSVLSSFARWDANILTINQSVPKNGRALVSVTAEISGMRGSPEELLAHLEGLDGIVKAEITAG